MFNFWSIKKYRQKKYRKIGLSVARKTAEIASELYLPNVLDMAWTQFQCSKNDISFDNKSPEVDLFIVWFHYSYMQMFKNLAAFRAEFRYPWNPPIQTLLDSPERLQADELEYVSLSCGQSFTFYEVRGFMTSSDIILRDLLRGVEISVSSVDVPHDYKVESIIYGLAFIFRNSGILVGCSVAFPSDMLDLILKLKRECGNSEGSISEEILSEGDLVLSIYREMYDLFLKRMASSRTSYFSGGQPD